MAVMLDRQDILEFVADVIQQKLKVTVLVLLLLQRQQRVLKTEERLNHVACVVVLWNL